MFGKPNVIVNTQGYRIGNYVNNILGTYTAHELIKLAELYSGGHNAKGTVMKKIFD